MKKRFIFSVFAQISRIFNILIYLQFMKDSYVVSDLHAIKTCTNQIVRNDRDVFDSIFRDDIVLVIEENFNAQLNQMFGFGGIMGYWRKVKNGTFILSLIYRKFRIGTSNELAGDFRAFKNAEGKKYNLWRFLAAKIPIIEKFYARLCKANAAVSDRITDFCYYPSREIFIEKSNNKFTVRQFTNREELNRYLINNEKMFFYTSLDSPWSAFKCKKKLVYEKAFADHLSFKKLRYIRIIYEIVEAMVYKTQKNFVNRAMFAILASRICDELNESGIKLELKFKKMAVTCFNVTLQTITYDSPSIMMTVLLNYDDQMVLSLFNSLKSNFIKWAKQITYQQVKVTWTTSYIDSVMTIMKIYGVIKEPIDFSVYPEIVGILFPHSFFLNHNPNINSCIIVRSCLCFKNLEKFCGYKKYFDDAVVKRIRYYTDDIMFSLVS
ncbi:hypothetical protein THOM_2379 [Trachipleistophora hominis]|uniref:Uncharacterized protein n=1 Tax=Trachipleistophora hominis TaxID=72359 RepID=L7JVD7_TRAHO|nr:hypothetical protein THOM_2379 [Trachipleistophora hominis]